MIRRRFADGILLGVAALCAPLARGSAQDTTRTQAVRIGLTYSPGTRPGVLVLPVSGANADSVRAIIARDLDYGDRVVPISPEGGDPPVGLLNYPVYAQLGAAAVVQASVTPGGSLHVAVHDVSAARVLNVGDFALPQPALGAEWRMAVHGASDEVERWITQQRGTSQTRILYERGGGLWIVDSDGADPHAVPGAQQAQSPAWHPSGRYFAFAQRADDASLQIMLRDIAAGTSRRVSTRGGTNTSPTFSPDGTTLVFSSGLDGADLYAASPFSKEPIQRLTVAPGSSANQMPSFSPDGKRIAYMSDRLGHPEVYIMDADGTNGDLLTNGASDEKPHPYRLNPSWSPDGRRIVFESQVRGISQLMLISPRDRSVIPLTSEGENEAPSWAPDGRHLVFSSTRGGTQQIWVLDVDSNRVRQLTRGPRARRAVWSPRLDGAR